MVLSLILIAVTAIGLHIWLKYDIAQEQKAEELRVQREENE